MSTRSSRHKSSSSRRAKDGTTGEAKERKPDVEDLRRIRDAYFGRSLREKRKIVIPASRPTSKASNALPRDVTVVVHKAKGSKSKTLHNSSRTSRMTRTHQGDDYVYSGTTPVGAMVEPCVTNKESYREPSMRSGRPKTSSSSRGESRGSILDEEVTPDDSISQVAMRPSRPARSSTVDRTPLRASLHTIAEQGDHSARTSISRKHSKRDSGLMNGFFRRHSTSVVTAPKLVECLTCGSDDVPSAHAAKLGCGHNMCNSCLKRIFRMSVQDPAHMPPRCCTDQHIPLQHVESLFDVRFKVLFNKKFDEYNTKNRIYCPNSKCGAWIRPSHFHTTNGRKYASCPKCSTRACVLCGMKLHRSRDCPRDPEIARLVEQAEKEGWKRCYSCNAMVELKEGCNHMTCRCLAEFCMVCGAKWKTCECPWFNYTQLPDGDRLNHMRIPEQIQVLYRHILAPDQQDLPPPARARTYQEEVDQRRRQEREDAELARRMQFASLTEPDDEPRGGRRGAELVGIGNAAGHFMNDDFVPNATNVVMDVFGDATMGRRGERASGRRHRQRQAEQIDAGLPANFLGDASVLLGGGSSRRPPRVS